MWWLTGTRGLLRGRGGVLVPFVGYVKMFFFMHQFTSRPFFIAGVEAWQMAVWLLESLAFLLAPLARRS